MFKRDKFYTPQYQVSRKYKNLARNSTYVYWHRDRGIEQCLDERYDFKEFRADVIVAQAGLADKIQARFNEEDRDV